MPPRPSPPPSPLPPIENGGGITEHLGVHVLVQCNFSQGWKEKKKMFNFFFVVSKAFSLQVIVTTLQATWAVM